ncbi:DUF5412 family protein [Lysinibacillus sp. NPDC056185]|uniref:DUF5412 family protein n=1 Tax=Lysinibacillus sp. NPDC056185 TaxID=3345739 RepID=UPI0039EF651B
MLCRFLFLWAQGEIAWVSERTARVQGKSDRVSERTDRVQEKIEIRSSKDSLGLKIYWQYRESEAYIKWSADDTVSTNSVTLNVPDATYDDRDKE